MKIEPVPGHPTWCYVEGRSQPWHLVQMEELDCNGWCSCESFYYQHFAAIEEALKRGERVVSRCKHIVAAREWALNRALRAHAPDASPPNRLN